MTEKKKYNVAELSSYPKYREYLTLLSYKKDLLEKKVKELAVVRTAYVKYLAENPHKEKKNKLEKDVAGAREELIGLIPKK